MRRREKIDKYLKLGIVASLLTICLAEMPIGWVKRPIEEGGMMAAVLSASGISYQQMAMGVFFGAIGISLQHYGYDAIALFLDENHCSTGAFWVRLGAKAVAYLGASAHCLCIALMFIVKMEVERATFIQLPDSIMQFGIWLLLPVYGLFFILFICMCVALALVVIREKTSLPKWAIAVNPLLVQILSPVFFILPNVAIVNSLQMALMGIGSLWTFAGFQFLLRSH